VMKVRQLMRQVAARLALAGPAEGGLLYSKHSCCKQDKRNGIYVQLPYYNEQWKCRLP